MVLLSTKLRTRSADVRRCVKFSMAAIQRKFHRVLPATTGRSSSTTVIQAAARPETCLISYFRSSAFAAVSRLPVSGGNVEVSRQSTPIRLEGLLPTPVELALSTHSRRSVRENL